MDLGISDKRAVVIGATSGLGLASARALADEGASLMLFSRGTDRLNSTANVLRSTYEVDVDWMSGDVTRQEDVAALHRHVSVTGGVDILVLNTPRPPSPMRDFLEETDDTRWDEAYVGQLQSALNVLRAFAASIGREHWGRIVAITSASVKQPMPRHALSTVFRAGVHAALKHLAGELGSRGITVNAVAPATIVTPTFETYHDLDARISKTAVGRAGTPEELGAVVAFLASQHAGFITGQTIQLDGGQTASLL